MDASKGVPGAAPGQRTALAAGGRGVCRWSLAGLGAQADVVLPPGAKRGTGKARP